METAKWICVGVIDITQLSVAGKTVFFLCCFILVFSYNLLSSPTILVSLVKHTVVCHVAHGSMSDRSHC
jgi:hypothetical protein